MAMIHPPSVLHLISSSSVPCRSFEDFNGDGVSSPLGTGLRRAISVPFVICQMLPSDSTKIASGLFRCRLISVNVVEAFLNPFSSRVIMVRVIAMCAPLPKVNFAFTFF